MGVPRKQLEKLKEPIAEYKYRLQSAKYGKATIVSYIDSRQVQDRLDEVVGPENWQDRYEVVDGKLFCGVSVNVEEGGQSQWVTKWDVGTESNMEAEKGNSSDAFKRAAVKWGVGRFLYSLGIITLATKTHTNNKEYPTTRDGKILWNVEEITKYCTQLVQEGRLDDTKPAASTTSAKAPAPNKKKTVAPAKPKGGIETPSAEFAGNQDKERKAKALEVYGKLDKAEVLKHLIKVEKLKYTSIEEFIENEKVDRVLEIYKKLKQ